MKIFGLFVFLIFAACSPPEAGLPSVPEGNYDPYSSQAVAYFQQIGFGSELGAKIDQTVKWTTQVRIKVENADSDDLREINKVVNELKELTRLSITLADDSPNLRIFFIPEEQFKIQCEGYSRYDDENMDGIFCVDWEDNTKVINEANALINSSITDRELRNHLIREELTQTFGIMKDSSAYTDSIFQQSPSSRPVSYSDIDRQVIQILYDERIRPGMTSSEVLTALRVNE